MTTLSPTREPAADLCGDTLEVPKSDESGAGAEFGPEELDTAAVYQDEVVVVIRELLPNRAVKDLIINQLASPALNTRPKPGPKPEPKNGSHSKSKPKSESQSMSRSPSTQLHSIARIIT